MHEAVFSCEHTYRYIFCNSLFWENVYYIGYSIKIPKFEIQIQKIEGVRRRTISPSHRVASMYFITARLRGLLPSERPVGASGSSCRTSRHQRFAGATIAQPV